MNEPQQESARPSAKLFAPVPDPPSEIRAALGALRDAMLAAFEDEAARSTIPRIQSTSREQYYLTPAGTRHVVENRVFEASLITPLADLDSETTKHRATDLARRAARIPEQLAAECGIPFDAALFQERSRFGLSFRNSDWSVFVEIQVRGQIMPRSLAEVFSDGAAT